MSMNTLLILFGPPGVGKNYIGAYLRDNHGFHHYDADEDLTAALKTCARQEQPFPQPLRDEYFQIVIQNIQTLMLSHPHLVVSQAIAKEVNRLQIARHFPAGKFILIEADETTVANRLRTRKDWISVEYAQKIRQIFESPQLPHATINNNEDATDLPSQIKSLV